MAVALLLWACWMLTVTKDKLYIEAVMKACQGLDRRQGSSLVTACYCMQAHCFQVHSLASKHETVKLMAAAALQRPNCKIIPANVQQVAQCLLAPV